MDTPVFPRVSNHCLELLTRHFGTQLISYDAIVSASYNNSETSRILGKEALYASDLLTIMLQLSA